MGGCGGFVFAPGGGERGWPQYVLQAGEVAGWLADVAVE